MPWVTPCESKGYLSHKSKILILLFQGEEGQLKYKNRNVSSSTILQIIHHLKMARKMKLTWNTIAAEGPAHYKVFHIELKLDHFTTMGSGTSIKRARRSAAFKMFHVS